MSTNKIHIPNCYNLIKSTKVVREWETWIDQKAVLQQLMIHFTSSSQLPLIAPAKKQERIGKPSTVRDQVLQALEQYGFFEAIFKKVPASTAFCVREGTFLKQPSKFWTSLYKPNFKRMAVPMTAFFKTWLCLSMSAKNQATPIWDC